MFFKPWLYCWVSITAVSPHPHLIKLSACLQVHILPSAREELPETHTRSVVCKVWFPDQHHPEIVLAADVMFHSRPTESGTLGMGPSHLCFNKLPNAHCRFENHCSRISSFRLRALTTM